LLQRGRAFVVAVSSSRDTLPCPPSEPPIVFLVEISPIGDHVHARVSSGRSDLSLTGTLVMPPDVAAEMKRRLEPTSL
jgi:hypothetical protein